MRLRDKVLVIIGGTSGLGLSAALAYVKEGAQIGVLGRDADKLQVAKQALGNDAVVLSADATEPEAANRMIDAMVARFGKLDGLYHVAGGSGRKHGDGPLHQLTDNGWSFTLQTNLNSVFYSNRAAVQQFLRQKTGGTVLNMGSVLAHAPSPKYFSTHAYAAAKAAIEGMTRSAAAYYAGSNIRFNVLAPALVATPMSQRAQENRMILDFMKTKQPLDGGRIGQPSDLDSAAVFFMSDESRFVTGQVLSIDGGWGVSEGQSSNENLS